MAYAKVEAMFDGNAPFSPPPALHAGAVVRGVVSVTPAADVECRHLWVALQWRTEGRGDRETSLAQKLDLFQGRLAAGAPIQVPFQFVLPQAPWSYSGKYVSIVWEVAIDVDVPWKVNPRGAFPFVLTGASKTPSEDAAANAAMIETLAFSPHEFSSTAPGAAPVAKGRVDLVVHGIISSENQVMQAIRREMPHLSLQEIQEIINTAPSTVMENVTSEEAEAVAVRLTAAGATVRIVPWEP